MNGQTSAGSSNNGTDTNVVFNTSVANANGTSISNGSTITLTNGSTRPQSV